MRRKEANHNSARSQRPKLEGPASDNPIAGPRTGTTRSEPSAPASEGAGGRRNEPVSRLAFACPAQPPSKAGGASPRDGERHHGVGKAHQSTESDRTGRGAAHHAGPRGTPERHTGGHNEGTRTGAQQQWPPAAANPGGRVCVRQRTQPLPATETPAILMEECAPGGYPAPAGYEQPPSGSTTARPAACPAPAGSETAAVRIDECATGWYPAPPGYEQPPSGWTSERPARTPRTHNTAHPTHSTTHRASTPVHRSQVAQDTTHPTQHTEQAHR